MILEAIPGNFPHTGGGWDITNGVTIPRVENFRPLHLIIEEKRDIGDDINHVLELDDKNGEVLPEYYVIRNLL